MAQRIPIPLLGGENRGRVATVNNQESINLYVTRNAPGAKGMIALYGTPGLDQLDNAPDQVGRSNGVEWKGLIYFVIGRGFYSINTEGTPTLIGNLATTTGRCSIAKGRSYIMLVDGTAGYTYNGTTFAQIADLDFPNDTTHVTYLDGRFIVYDAGTDDFYISANEDPTSWDPLEFAVAESNPDNILGLISTEKDLYILGSETTQPYYNSGNNDFTFDPYQNGVMEFGLLAQYSLVKAAEGLIWLATSAEGGIAIVKVQGFTPQVISDTDLNWQLGELVSPQKAYAMLYRDHGHVFYCITFPDDAKTFVVDIASGSWHTRESRDASGLWRCAGIGYLQRRLFATDRLNGNIYRVRFDYYRDGSEVITRRRRTQVVHKDNRRMTWWELVLEVQAGVGLTTGTITPGGTFERITNGTFDTTVNSWVQVQATVAWNSDAGGVMRLTAFGSNQAEASQLITVKSRDPVTLNFDIESLTAQDEVTVLVGTTQGGNEIAETAHTTAGSKTEVFTATQDDIYIGFRGEALDIDSLLADIDNVSLTDTIPDVDDGVGVCPHIQMRYSDDHGRTWSYWLTAEMGKIGEYGRLMHWNKLGESRNRLFEFQTSDPVEVALVNAYADIEVLAH